MYFGVRPLPTPENFFGCRQIKNIWRGGYSIVLCNKKKGTFVLYICSKNKSSNTSVRAPSSPDAAALIGDFCIFEKVSGHTSAGSPLSAGARSTTTMNYGLIKPGRSHPSIAEYAWITSIQMLCPPQTEPGTCRHREAAAGCALIHQLLIMCRFESCQCFCINDKLLGHSFSLLYISRLTLYSAL